MAEPAPTAAERDPASDVAAAARTFRLALHGRFRGGIGERRGRSAGGAQDFVDFRDYAPGDDLRHLDWRGYARSDQLRVRLFEDEVAPHGELLVDLSPSMASTPHKERALRDLLALGRGWIADEGGRARCLQLGGGELADLERAPCTGPPQLALPAVRLRPRSVRVLISDFLVEQDPTPLLQQIAATAARFVVLQLLDPWELQPSPERAVTLRDCETDQRLDTAIDARAIAGYAARLQRLQDGLRAAVLGCGGAFAVVAADRALTMCRRDLLPARIVEVRP